MCLAVPGRVERIRESDGVRFGRVDFGGVVREVCLEFVPEARAGDWALVHVGFAIAMIDEEEARATRRALLEAGLLEAELGEIRGGDACPRLPETRP